jgi:hypothetical protein
MFPKGGKTKTNKSKILKKTKELIIKQVGF